MTKQMKGQPQENGTKKSSFLFFNCILKTIFKIIFFNCEFNNVLCTYWQSCLN